ncbi:MAG TPA: EamA family transporter [Candidatus Onthovicinus excrementipullorum]|nr:EamA family transporter [Candidatus Onthovicinus excrementipullorum]
MSWILFAFGSAFFAGVTAILAKIGIRGVNSNVATAIRTIVILIFSWAIVFLVGSWRTIPDLTLRTLTFLILSGLATGASWLCYFRALQLGDVNKVTPIDKSSTVLTILFAFLFLGEPVGVFKVIGMIAIAVGTYLMIARQPGVTSAPPNRRWIIYAILSAVFAALTSILGKIGIQEVESNLGTAIRTGVVLVMAWLVVFVTHGERELRRIDGKSWLFILLSGLMTGLSWLCYYRALQDGPASVVAPIDKLSILVTILFSAVFLREKLSKKAAIGLVLVTAGTLVMLF